MKKTSKAAELLERAASLIEEGGHCKKVFATHRKIRGREVRCYCTLGALDEAVRVAFNASEADVWPAHVRAKFVLAQTIKPAFKGSSKFDYEDEFDIITGWNDAARRRKGEVVRVLREAAHLALLKEVSRGTD